MADGVLRALVYRAPGNRLIALEVDGDPPNLEPWAAVSPGGEWEEVQIVFEDSPPLPPTECGLWEMTWPWHYLNREERAELGPEYCCLYEGKAQWTKVETDTTIGGRDATTGGET